MFGDSAALNRPGGRIFGEDARSGRELTPRAVVAGLESAPQR
jgi:hypothetical protein